MSSYARRFKRHRKGSVLPYSEHNFDAEAGDHMVTSDGRLFRLAESRGKFKRAAGVLTPIEIKPPNAKARAVIRHGEVWWEW